MSTSAFRLIGVGGLVLVAMIFVVGHIPATINRGMDAAAVVALVTGVSVGIERTIEAFWSVVGSWKGAAWPMKIVGDSLDGLTSSLDKGLDPFFKRSRAVLGEVEAFGTSATAEVTAAKAQLDALETQVSALKDKAKDRQQITSYLSAATGAINYLQVACAITVPGEGQNLEQNARDIASYYAKHEERLKSEWAGKPDTDPDLAKRLTAVGDAAAKAVDDAIETAGTTAREAKRSELLSQGFSFDTKKVTPETQKQVDVAGAAARATQASVEIRKRRSEGLAKVADAATIAQSAATGLSDFLATFTDNPGRRVISVMAGMGAGLVVAAFLGMDLFSSMLGTPPAKVSELTFRGLGAWLFSFNAGLVLTGLLVGLGSNPTHEVITALQGYNQSKRSDNTPNASTAPVSARQTTTVATSTGGAGDSQQGVALEMASAQPDVTPVMVTTEVRSPQLVRFR